MRSHYGRLLTTLVLSLMVFGICTTSPAQTARIYGDVNVAFMNQRLNPAYINTDTAAEPDNMVASLQNQLYLSIADPSLGSIFLETLIQGSLAPEGGQPPQLSLGIHQLYLQAPLLESVRITLGKKPVALGYASFFNVSNRLSPRTLSSISAGDTNPAIVQLDWFLANFLTVSGFFYFSDTAKWDKTCEALALQLQLDPFNLDVYGYLEKQSIPYLGYNSALQLDRLKIYAEGMFSQHRQQARLRADPSNNPATDFELPDLENLGIQQVLGLSLASDVANFNLEYLYRSEGLSDSERQRLDEYLIRLPSAALRSLALADCYRQFAWDTHYLAFNTSADLVNQLIHIDGTLMVSTGADPTHWSDTASILGRFQLTFVPSSSLQITVYIQHVWGGSQSEFVNFQPMSLIGGVVCSFSFSSRNF